MSTLLEYVCAALCTLIILMFIVDMIRFITRPPRQVRSKLPDDVGELRRKLYGKDTSR